MHFLPLSQHSPIHQVYLCKFLRVFFSSTQWFSLFFLLLHANFTYSNYSRNILSGLTSMSGSLCKKKRNCLQFELDESLIQSILYDIRPSSSFLLSPKNGISKLVPCWRYQHCWMMTLVWFLPAATFISFTRSLCPRLYSILSKFFLHFLSHFFPF